uniref:Uncharacterized protein n=2 Tax=Octactis speculum TaxID=3111310 RepID=A0A7S2BLA5_9STRA|mmetsp:Transcript_2449/g.2832  ORF Transcript_2449/g.2832 Transcript_2449/m.2832 type:complete len:106 (+) Transcript_2449:22-339(+)
MPTNGFVAITPSLQSALDRAGDTHDPLNKTAAQSYQAWLGFYNSHLRKLRWDKRTLVEAANEYALSTGWPYAPPLQVHPPSPPSCLWVCTGTLRRRRHSCWWTCG